MTPAIIALKTAGIQYTLHEYSHDHQTRQSSSYGEEAANCLNVPIERVFKTLVISCDTNDHSKQLAIAIIPASHQLNLKALAKSLKTKKASMADATAAQNATAYVLGGISPFGQKKRLLFTLDTSAKNFTSIFVSGGKRGLEIEVAPDDLITLCHATTTDIKGRSY